MPYSSILFVFIGGGTGSVARYFLGKWLQSALPMATFTANVLASLFFGLLLGFITFRLNDNSVIKLLFLTGFCGGLSTFSTFNAEVFEMLKNGNFTIALLYIVASVATCLASFGFAGWISTIIFKNNSNLI